MQLAAPYGDHCNLRPTYPWYRVYIPRNCFRYEPLFLSAEYHRLLACRLTGFGSVRPRRLCFHPVFGSAPLTTTGWPCCLAVLPGYNIEGPRNGIFVNPAAVDHCIWTNILNGLPFSMGFLFRRLFDFLTPSRLVIFNHFTTTPVPDFQVDCMGRVGMCGWTAPNYGIPGIGILTESNNFRRLISGLIFSQYFRCLFLAIPGSFWPTQRSSRPAGAIIFGIFFFFFSFRVRADHRRSEASEGRACEASNHSSGSDGHYCTRCRHLVLCMCKVSGQKVGVKTGQLSIVYLLSCPYPSLLPPAFFHHDGT